MTVLRTFGTVREISPPFDAGKRVEVKITLDTPQGTVTFLWSADYADAWVVGQPCVVTIEPLLN